MLENKRNAWSTDAIPSLFVELGLAHADSFTLLRIGGCKSLKLETFILGEFSNPISLH